MRKKIKLINVRLSFPCLFHRSSFNGEEGKYESTFLINKETQLDQYAKVQSAIRELIEEAKIKVPEDKWCLKDGDNIEYEGYYNHFALKSSTNLRPTVINQKKEPIREDDNIIYAGCYVNALVDVWVQNNNYGKRVNSNLYGVQFVRDGEPFGVASQDVLDSFDIVGIEDEF